MNTRKAHLSPRIVGFLLACGSLPGIATAQDHGAGMTWNHKPGKPMYAIGRPTLSADPHPAVALPTWNGSFKWLGIKYSFNMVGTAPSTNTTTTVKAYIIPLKIVIGSSTFDPSFMLPNGNTVVQNTVASPIFDSTTTYTQGGVNVGKTQYIDAFQRGNFWGTVKSHPKYHLLLGGPTVLPTETLTPPVGSSSVGSPLGFNVGLVDYTYFDGQLQSILSKLSQIQPDTLPIFLTYDVYLTQSGQCCIGGYHNGVSGQAYAHATYVDQAGAFAQDVSALSHEIGEWADDPLVNNTGNPVCFYTGILEVGDPLEGNTNYGGYPYKLHGFTYNLQDLVFLPYFGAPATRSVNGYSTFQGETIGVCSNGG